MSGMYIGGYDYAKVLNALLNALVRKGVISHEEAKAIVKAGEAQKP